MRRRVADGLTKPNRANAKHIKALFSMLATGGYVTDHLTRCKPHGLMRFPAPVAQLARRSERLRVRSRVAACDVLESPKRKLRGPRWLE